MASCFSLLHQLLQRKALATRTGVAMAFCTMALLGGRQARYSELGNGIRYRDHPNASDGETETD